MMNTLFYVLISLAFSAFFSGMEISYVSASKFRHEIDKKEEGSWIDRLLDIFYNNPNQFISTMLVGNNIALVIYGLQMAVLLEPVFFSWTANPAWVVLLQTLVSTILILFTGEFIPKTIFRINPNFSLRVFAIPLFLVYVLLYPVSKLASGVSYLILRLAGAKNVKSSAEHGAGRVELGYFLQQRIEEAPDDSDMDTEVKILQNALDFSNVRLRDCMVPRTEIVACGRTSSVTDLRMRFVETGLSKILVYDETIDNIIGYIHSSELFKHPEDWVQKIREVFVVPETMAAHKLMRLFMQEKKSVAVVVDEFGGTSGMVTLEDLVEEIFGEIEDEHDLTSRVAERVAENEYLLSGRMEIDTLNEQFELDLPESDEYVTVAGFILHHYRNFPKINETLEIGRFTFKIVRMTATKIDLVRMKVSD